MCESGVSSEISFIQKQFLCGVPVHKIIWSNLFNNISWDDQEALIACTVDSELVRKYPIKISYQRSFLKFVLQRLEKQGADIHDDVFSAFGRLVALGDVSECFKHYSVEGGKIITLRENPNIISEGTTGLCSWQASLALSEWCLANKPVLKDKAILELGSGVGLTGLTVALHCGAKKVFLTDCHQSVLQALCLNVKLNVHSDLVNNKPESRERVPGRLLCETIETSETTIEVLDLPWEDITEKTCEFANPDLLLAADVIYDSSLFPSFINALSCFFGRRNTKELIIACTERNKDTLEEFLSLLVNEGFNYEELELVQQKNFVWSTECPIRMFSVKFLSCS